jgi:hypothetical protein
MAFGNPYGVRGTKRNRSCGRRVAGSSIDRFLAIRDRGPALIANRGRGNQAAANHEVGVHLHSIADAPQKFGSLRCRLPAIRFRDGARWLYIRAKQVGGNTDRNRSQR